MEHSAIFFNFVKLPVVINIFVLSIFEWLFYTGFTVIYEWMNFMGSIQPFGCHINCELNPLLSYIYDSQQIKHEAYFVCANKAWASCQSQLHSYYYRDQTCFSKH